MLSRLRERRPGGRASREPTPGEGAGGGGNESGGASSEAGSTGEGGSPDAPSGASRNTADSSGCSISFPRHTSDTHGLMTIGAVLGLWFCRGGALHDLCRCVAPNSVKDGMPSQASVALRTLELIVYVRQDSVRFPLPDSGEVSIGRGPRNDVRIDDSSVSRNHVVLRISRSKIEVEDLGSSNGTTLLRERREDSLAEETSTGVSRDNQLPGGQAGLDGRR